MYSDKDLKFLKQEYMKQDYPEDLNEFVLNAISKADKINLKDNSTKNMFVWAASLLFFIIIPSFFLQMVYFDSDKTNMIRSVPDKSTVIMDSTNSNKLMEDQFIISVYPKGKELTIDDKIYNINKITGEIVDLSDILIKDVVGVDQDIYEQVNKFYINDEGMYVIITANGSIVIDDALKYKIFNHFE